MVPSARKPLATFRALSLTLVLSAAGVHCTGLGAGTSDAGRGGATDARPDVGSREGGRPGTGHDADREASGRRDSGALADAGSLADAGTLVDAFPRDHQPSEDAASEASRGFFPGGLFDMPLPSAPTVAPHSSSIVASILRGQVNSGYDFAIHAGPGGGGEAIYYAPAGAPLIPITVKDEPGGGRACNDFQGGAPGATGPAIPLPPNAWGTSGVSDSPLTIYQRSTDTLWETWRTFRTDAGAWSACWGGMMTNASTSGGVFPSPYGLSASGIAYLATVITYADVQAGVINHAIGLDVFVTPGCNPAIASPADRTDCHGSAPDGGTVADLPSEGTWLFLPKNVPEPAGLQPLAKLIFKAWQDYGMVVIDQAGAVEVNAEDSEDWTLTGHAAPDPLTLSMGTQHNYDVLQPLPWNELQVVTR